MNSRISTKLSALLSILLLICISCEEDIPTNEPYSAKVQEKAKEYGLNNVLDSVEYFNFNTDSTAILFSGFKNKELYIGCFKTSTKEVIIPWMCVENLDTIITLNQGYHNAESIAIGEYLIK